MKTKYWYWMWRTFLGPSRLRRRFMRRFLAAGLVPFALMGVVSFVLVERVHRIDVATLEGSVAHSLAESAARVVSDVLASLDVDVAYDEAAPVKFSEQEFVLRAILEKHAALAELSLACTTPAFCDEGQETSRIVAAGASGAAPGPVPLLDRRGSPEFTAAAGGATYVGEASPRALEWRVALGAPVRNKGGAVVGAIRAELLPDPFAALTARTRVGEMGYAYLVDGRGVILAHPDAHFLGAAAGELPTVRAALAPGVAPEAGRFARNFHYDSLGGVAVSGVAAPVPELGWAALVEWPRAETQELTNAILLQIVLFALLAAAAIAILATRTAFTLIAPIAYLTQAANVIGAGNFSYRTKMETGDELEDLGKNLNRMAENLKKLEEVHELELKAKYLTESLRKEQEFSKLKDQFITTVSHQFNTPLAVISWTLEEIRKPDASHEAVREGLGRIAESRRDILNIANDLLTLSEVGFSYEMRKVERIDLAALTAEVLRSLAPSLETKRMAAPAPRVRGEAVIEGNRFAATKVVENLIANAIDYSNDSGPLMIEIVDEGESVRWSIEDRGIGIPAEDQKSIFQEFFRAKNAVTKKNVGTGLGLFLVRTIVEQGFRGKAWFASEENRGSTFNVSLPKRHAAAPEGEQPPAADAPSPAPKIDSGLAAR